MKYLKRVALVAVLALGIYQLMIVPLLDPTAAEDISPGDDIVVFTTAWCGACDAARDYLVASGVPFRELDIEASAEARRHYESIGASGVPVAIFGDRRIDGFSAQSYARAIENLGALE